MLKIHYNHLPFNSHFHVNLGFLSPLVLEEKLWDKWLTQGFCLSNALDRPSNQFFPSVGLSVCL